MSTLKFTRQLSNTPWRISRHWPRPGNRFASNPVPAPVSPAAAWSLSGSSSAMASSIEHARWSAVDMPRGSAIPTPSRCPSACGFPTKGSGTIAIWGSSDGEPSARCPQIHSDGGCTLHFSRMAFRKVALARQGCFQSQPSKRSTGRRNAEQFQPIVECGCGWFLGYGQSLRITMRGFDRRSIWRRLIRLRQPLKCPAGTGDDAQSMTARSSGTSMGQSGNGSSATQTCVSDVLWPTRATNPQSRAAPACAFHTPPTLSRAR